MQAGGVGGEKIPAPGDTPYKNKLLSCTKFRRVVWGFSHPLQVTLRTIEDMCYLADHETAMLNLKAVEEEGEIRPRDELSPRPSNFRDSVLESLSPRREDSGYSPRATRGLT